jgi:hypothetical protein
MYNDEMEPLFFFCQKKKKKGKCAGGVSDLKICPCLTIDIIADKKIYKFRD